MISDARLSAAAHAAANNEGFAGTTAVGAPLANKRDHNHRAAGPVLSACRLRRAYARRRRPASAPHDSAQRDVSDHEIRA